MKSRQPLTTFFHGKILPVLLMVIVVVFAVAVGIRLLRLPVKPDADEYVNMGKSLVEQGDLFGAVSYFQQALRINPDNASVHYNLGTALLKQGDLETAMAHFKHALRIDSEHVEALGNLGGALYAQGRFDEAIHCWEQAVRLSPQNHEVKNNLAWVLATASDPSLRDGKRALEVARAATKLSGYRPPASYLDTMAAAYAEAGRYPEAVEAARRALNAAAGQQTVENKIRMRLRLYEQGMPYHEE